MACIRLTLLRPRTGMDQEAQRLLTQLDAALRDCEGLLFSFVTRMEPDRLGRVALWQSKAEANREATRGQILSLRSRLRYLSVETQELLMEVESGFVASELAALLSGSLDLETPEGAEMLPAGSA